MNECRRTLRGQSILSALARAGRNVAEGEGDEEAKGSGWHEIEDNYLNRISSSISTDDRCTCMLKPQSHAGDYQKPWHYHSDTFFASFVMLRLFFPDRLLASIHLRSRRLTQSRKACWNCKHSLQGTLEMGLHNFKP